MKVSFKDCLVNKRTAALTEVELGWNYLKVCKHGSGEQRRWDRLRFIFSLFFCHWNIAFQMPASLRICVKRKHFWQPPINELTLGEPKDIHYHIICKRQPCAATVSPGFICPPDTELNLQARGEERAPSSACRITCRYCGVLRAVLGSALWGVMRVLIPKISKNSKWEGGHFGVQPYYSIGNT